MIYDRKLSSAIAKEKGWVRNGKTRWNEKKKRGHKRKRNYEDHSLGICAHCPNMGNQFRCIRCPFYTTADGSKIIMK